MTIDELRGSRVLITGASGFLGRHLHRHLEEDVGCRVYAVGLDGKTAYDGLHAMGYDLEEPGEVDCLFSAKDFDCVFHLAGYNGGIGLNLARPADIFRRNTMMALNVMDAASRRTTVRKVVSVVASCAYPAEQWVDMPPRGDAYDVFVMSKRGERETCPEGEFLDGPPHATVAGHGYAKRNLQLASSFYRRQYGLNAVCACPTTLYGPGDSFDPARTKVMGAMVKRFVDAQEAGEQEVTCWGTGAAMREFLYAPDAARLLVETMLRYDDSDVPLNLGTGQELSVKELAGLVAACVEFRGEISWDTSKPDGQLRKRLDLTRMRATLPPFEPTPLEEGVRATVGHYRGLKKGNAA